MTIIFQTIAGAFLLWSSALAERDHSTPLPKRTEGQSPPPRIETSTPLLPVENRGFLPATLNLNRFDIYKYKVNATQALDLRATQGKPLFINDSSKDATPCWHEGRWTSVSTNHAFRKVFIKNGGVPEENLFAAEDKSRFQNHTEEFIQIVKTFGLKQVGKFIPLLVVGGHGSCDGAISIHGADHDTCPTDENALTGAGKTTLKFIKAMNDAGITIGKIVLAGCDVGKQIDRPGLVWDPNVLWKDARGRSWRGKQVPGMTFNAVRTLAAGLNGRPQVVALDMPATVDPNRKGIFPSIPGISYIVRLKADESKIEE